MPPVLYLIDGHALAYRTYYALTRGSNPFATSSGEPTAGVFGFTSVLLRLLEQERPDYLAVAFDTGKTFRDELFPEYKGTRAKMPDDLRSQIERIRQLVDAFNIPRLEVEGYEADDVLGSVAVSAAAQGYAVKIITGDRDLLQLVTDRIVVNLPGKSLGEARDYRPPDVLDYLGVRPDQIVDYKALVGDNSDNIPGVAGVGEKTAVNLLKTYDTLEGIYAHLEDLPSGVRRKLEEGRTMADLSHKLAQIVTDLQIHLDMDRARTTEFNPSEVESIFRELEFRTLIDRLIALYPLYGKQPSSQALQTGAASSPARGQLNLFEMPTSPSSISKPVIKSMEGGAAIQTRIINSSEALTALCHLLENARVIAFDTETTSTDPMSAGLVGISLAVEDSLGYYIPIGHTGDDQSYQLPAAKVLEALRPSLTSPNIDKVGHNVKYDYVMLARLGLEVMPLSFDTMIAEWLINPASRNLGLKNLAWVRLDHRMTEIEALIGKGKNQKQMNEVPIADAAPYAAADAAVVLKLIPQLTDELETAGALKLLKELEMPLVPILADMEMAGITLDRKFLSQMSVDLTRRLSELEQAVFEQAGMTFNLNSTQQLSKALFDQLKLAPPDRTKKTTSGHYSTAADVLEGMRSQHPVVDWVLEYRELAKLKSTYVEALPLQVNNQTGRIHTSYNQTGSVTGRIASMDPNLQNIPIRTEVGRQVRKAFVAASGYELLAVDYSQVELRIVAHMSDDQAMLAAFQADQDIHAATAAAIFSLPLEAVSKEQRRNAKAINFGLIYGMSAFGLTRSSELTLAESEDFVEAYFNKFPGVKRYLDSMRVQAAEQGYVETLLGRRRYFPGLKTERNVNIRNREEREAINAPIQGTAADIMKLAMLHLPGALHKAGLNARILLQVHDELVLECPTAEVLETAAIVQQTMENAFDLKVPLKTEARRGINWGSMTTMAV